MSIVRLTEGKADSRYPLKSPAGVELRGQGSSFYVDYLSTTKVCVRHGWREANGIIYTQTGSFDTPFATGGTVSADTNTYTFSVAHGLTPSAGEVLYVTGFTNAANNDKKEVVSYTSTTIVVVESLTTEATVSNVVVESVGKAHAMTTSLASGFDMHYILLDDSASSSDPTNPVFIDTVSEPSRDYAKSGWYIGDDKVIGAIASPAASSTIAAFSAIPVSPNIIQVIVVTGDYAEIALNQIPTSAWAEPGGSNTDILTPVNAIAVRVWMRGSDANSSSHTGMTSAEMVDLGAVWFQAESGHRSSTVDTGTGRVELVTWIRLFESRKVKIAGESGDDVTLSAQLRGLKYEI
jgi:hypothetical protein